MAFFQPFLFVVQHGAKVSFSPVAVGKAVRIGGAHRLRLLEGLLPFADDLEIYNAPDRQASAFVVVLGSLRAFFAFSADAYRGFSGEGKALEHLSKPLPLEWIHGVNSLLTASLSSMGLLGYDLAAHTLSTAGFLLRWNVYSASIPDSKMPASW